MFRSALAVALLLASIPAAAASTLTFNFAGTTGSAASYAYTDIGSQGSLTLTASARKFFPAPELLVGNNLSTLATGGLVTRSSGSNDNPAGLGVFGGGDNRQIDTNSPGSAAAPLREALLLSGDKQFALHSLTLNFVDPNDTLLVFGVDTSG